MRAVGGHLPNGEAPDADEFAYKMAWLAALKDWLATEIAAHPKLVLMGDFNRVVVPQRKVVH